MKWNKNLYIGESISKKADKIKWKINHNAGTLRVHVITYPSNDSNLLDIIPARELLQKGYPKKDLCIIGLAGDYDEAVELVTTIIKEAVDAGFSMSIKEYISSFREDE